MFFQPEDGTKGTGEEDANDGRKCNNAFGKAGMKCFLLYLRML